MISYEKITYRTLISCILILTIAASSAFCYRSSAKYKDVFTLMLIFLAFFVYICFADDLTKGELDDTYELMTDSPDGKLLDYHVKTALNCCYKGDSNDDYRDTLAKLVEQNFNAFDFFVVAAGQNPEPMVELGDNKNKGDTINSALKFETAIAALYEAFYTPGTNSNKTLFIILRVKSPASENNSNRIYSILNNSALLGNRLIKQQPDKYLKYTPDATYRELQGKVVLLICNVGGSALNTETTDADNLQSIMYSTISISGKDKLQDVFGLNQSHVHVCSHLGMAAPDLYEYNNNEVIDCKALLNNVFHMGIHFIAVNVYNNDGTLTECGEILGDEFESESTKVRSSKSCIEHGEIFARLGYIPKITSEINALRRNQKAQDLNIKRSSRFIQNNLKTMNKNQKKNKKFMESVERNLKDVLNENDNVRQDLDDMGKDINSTSSNINTINKKLKQF